MATHSKGSYVAYRSGRNALTSRELAARKRIAEECEKFCNEPFPNGAEIIEWNGVDGGLYPCQKNS